MKSIIASCVKDYSGDKKRVKAKVKAVWTPTTLDEMGLNEDFLESAIIETPGLLSLQARRKQIREPYHVVSQRRFTNPQLRTKIPDIIILSGSGEVLMVEVKKSSNPELRDRNVIAQAIDYASSLSSKTDKELTTLFGQGKEDDWPSLINSLFPDAEAPYELADDFLSNIRAGKLHVVIACDLVPPGLDEVVKSVAAQKYLNFSLDVVEIRPFRRKNGPSDEVMFVPHIRLSDRIVARTVITVMDQHGGPLPQVKIETVGMDELEDGLSAVRRGPKAIWYAVNGVQGAELPTLFYRSFKSLKERGRVEVALADGVDAEAKIADFKKHRQYAIITNRDGVTVDQWEAVFSAIRNAKSMEERAS